MAELFSVLFSSVAGAVFAFALLFIVAGVFVVVLKKGGKIGPSGLEVGSSKASKGSDDSNSDDKKDDDKTITVSYDMFKRLIDAVEPVYESFLKRNDDIDKMYFAKLTTSQTATLRAAINSMILEHHSLASSHKDLETTTSFLRLFLEHDFNSYLLKSIENLKSQDVLRWTEFDIQSQTQQMTNNTVMNLKVQIAGYPMIEREIFVSLFTAAQKTISDTIGSLLSDYLKSSKERKAEIEENLANKISMIDKKIKEEVERYK